MEKYKKISEYLENRPFAKDDLKEMILTSALDLGCNAANNFDQDVMATSHVFTTLYYFNDILDSVE